MKIPFNKPFLTGKENLYIKDAVDSGKLSGNGLFTKKCHEFFQTKYGFMKCLLTTSCTDALEMAAILINTREGDEIIMPSYTFVSTANAFVLRGAKIVFADSNNQNPNINVSKIEQLITNKTKAIVPVHYAGIACDMDEILRIAEKYNLFVIEDAAQAIDSYYKGKPLGSLGHLSAFSFHETKNIISGEGGMLVINDEKLMKRAEIIWEKGTNRAEFFRGEVNKYGWVDIGSSFLPSEITAAFLFAQLENLNEIQDHRKALWNNYFNQLEILESQNKIILPHLPDFSTNNAHMFYFICNDSETQKDLLKFLNNNEILAVFHYLSLHSSLYYSEKHDHRNLEQSDRYSNCLIRLPLYFELTESQQSYIVKQIMNFFNV